MGYRAKFDYYWKGAICGLRKKIEKDSSSTVGSVLETLGWTGDTQILDSRASELRNRYKRFVAKE